MIHSEFTKFCELPQELQDIIWRFAVTSTTPRVHCLDVYPRSGSVVLMPTSSLPYSTRPARLIASVCYSARSIVLANLPHQITLHTATHGEIKFRINGQRDILLLRGLDTSVVRLFNSAVNGGKPRPYYPRMGRDVTSSSSSSSKTDETTTNKTGIQRLGLPRELRFIAISVEEDSYYQAFNVWPIGRSDRATNALRMFLLSFPHLHTLFLEVNFPISSTNINQARMLVKGLSDPELKYQRLDWIPGTAIENSRPDWLCDGYEDGAREGETRTEGGGGVDDGRDWFLATIPYKYWGMGIPSLEKVLDAALWRKARLRKVLSDSDDGIGMQKEEIEWLENMDARMLLRVQ